MIKPRNPLLVFFWSLGLLVLMLIPGTYLSGFAGTLVSEAGFDAMMSGDYSDPMTDLAGGLAAFFIGIPWALLVTVLLWRRSFDWLRLRFNFRLLVYGLTIGIVLPLAPLGMLAALGTVSVSSAVSQFSVGQWLAVLVGVFCHMLYVGVLEELVFRGMVCREWAVKWGWPIAGVASGLYFGAAHIPSMVTSLNWLEIILVLAAGISVGLMLTAMYVRSKSLWLPIGFHAGWNFSLTKLLGANMSGEGLNYGLLKTELSGNELLTGGAFGMEASLVSILVWLALAIVFIRWGKATLLPARPEIITAASAEAVAASPTE